MSIGLTGALTTTERCATFREIRIDFEHGLLVVMHTMITSPEDDPPNSLHRIYSTSISSRVGQP